MGGNHFLLAATCPGQPPRPRLAEERRLQRDVLPGGRGIAVAGGGGKGRQRKGEAAGGNLLLEHYFVEAHNSFFSRAPKAAATLLPLAPSSPRASPPPPWTPMTPGGSLADSATWSRTSTGCSTRTTSTSTHRTHSPTCSPVWSYRCRPISQSSPPPRTLQGSGERARD